MEVDETRRQLLLKIMGVTGQDPYQNNFVRVNFDGTGFTRLTTGDGNHGISVGGQNALAGLLHHGDFYKVGVADCGCHDNRMDKIWWNEAWMGWPVDESYERNSNVTHAGKLTGKLMLIVGELDSNVDPASTSQVINALENADQDFEFVLVMNANHGAAETPYGKRRRAEFLLRSLLSSD